MGRRDNALLCCASLSHSLYTYIDSPSATDTDAKHFCPTLLQNDEAGWAQNSPDVNRPCERGFRQPVWPGLTGWLQKNPKSRCQLKNVCSDQGRMPVGHCKVLKNYLLYAAVKVTKVGDISSSECFVIKRRRTCKITAKGGDWEECGSLLWTCFGGGGCCVWAASVCFCSRPKLTILADKPLAGRSVCLCPLSRGHWEEQQRRGKKGL